jgi:mono/diheme cytochrome c family protein
MMPRQSLCTLFLSALLFGLGDDAARSDDNAPSAEQARFFESQVRPLLAEHCIKCHGPRKQKGHLRLDGRSGLLTGGDSGPAVVPGNPDESLLMSAVKYEGPEMPPKGKLTPRQVETLAQWVKMGSPWPGEDKAAGVATVSTTRRGAFKITDKDRAHWAFRPIEPPAVPTVKDRAWGASPIDAFILARLEAKGLKPNPPASKQELIRRAAYDLTGLPPTPAEVDAFLADSSPTAYEALIDRLLDSPRYGEKWGRHWLDLVRFAETNSYERDGRKPNAWRYRDYVIRSLNDDKPYDRFVREQLAGDELADPTADSVIATAYYRLGIWDDEPTDREQARYDGLDDIVATTSQVFLGLTVDCARCHDHKLDPIPQKDYYRLLSFFHNVNHYRNGGPSDEVPLLSGPEERKNYEQALRDLERRRNETQEQLTAIENEFRARYQATRGGSVAQKDIDDLNYRYYRDTWDRLPDFSAIKAEDAGSLPRGQFDLGPRTRDTAFGFVFEGALLVPEAGEYAFYLDSDDGSRLNVAGRQVAIFDGVHGTGDEQTGVIELPKGRVPIRLEYFQKYNGLGLSVAWSGPSFGRRSLSSSGSGSPDLSKRDLAQQIRQDGRALLGKDRFAEYEQLGRKMQKLREEKVPVEMALCVTEPGPKAPDTFVLVRGNANVKGDKVEPGFLEVLGSTSVALPDPAPGAKSSGRRRVLADWIASPDNPLTARVMANRVWQYHFGRGIVRSSNNFGLQGDKPTDPELLDWLAAEFIRQGWKLKPLHRLIMTSNAYRMSSRGNPEALANDPANDLLWRFEMRRLSAEEIRDSILAITGMLRLKMYGPGVFPEIPREVLAGQSVPGSGWDHSPVDEENRRSVYVHVKRSLMMPILEIFDIAETDRSTPARFSTTQPTQALAMLNSTFLNQQAGAFADRLRREAGGDVSKQVELALRLALARPPSKADVERGLTLIETLKTRDGVAAELALKSFCLVVLNLNEFVYLD